MEFEHFAGFDHNGVVEVVVINAEYDAVFFRCVGHFARLFGVKGHGLFNEHVDAVLGGDSGIFRVGLGRCEDVDGIGAFHGKHLFYVGVCAGNTVLRRECFGGFPV